MRSANCSSAFPTDRERRTRTGKPHGSRCACSRTEEAKKEFEEQIAIYPNGNETSNALYWRARLAEEENQPEMARAFYQKLSDRYRNYYYAELGRERMKKLPESSAQPGEYPLLDRIPPARSRRESHARGSSGGRSPPAESEAARKWRPGRFRCQRTTGSVPATTRATGNWPRRRRSTPIPATTIAPSKS